MLNNIRDDLNSFILENPGLNLVESDGKFEIVGLYSFLLKFSEVVFHGSCKLSFIVYKEFPNILPQLFIDNLPKNMDHIFKDGSACVGTIGQQIEFISKSESIVDYWNEFVKSYIYSVEYFREYGCYPYGERAHGAEGQLSYYTENWNIDYDSLIKLAIIVYDGTYRGHYPCPCGSKIRLRNCHGKFIIRFIENPVLKSYFFYEINTIIDWRRRNNA